MNTDYLFVPGLGNSGEDHWQSLWQTELQGQRVQQADWNRPDIVSWSAAVERYLLAAPRPAVIVAHSFGCLASVVAAAKHPSRVRALFLVAPADPDRFNCEHVLENARPALPAMLVASQNDPFMSFQDAAIWAVRWEAGFVSAGAAGHINPDSGHGPWRQGRYALDDLLVHEAYGEFSRRVAS